MNRKPLRHISQLLPAVLALLLLGFVFRSADLGRSWSLVRSLRWSIPLLLLPYLAATALETAGWWIVFGRLGVQPRFRALLLVRLMSDAVMLSLPSGAVISESVQLYLLKERCGLPFGIGVVAAFVRKFLVLLGHGLFLGIAVVLSWPLLQRASRIAIGRGGLPALLLAAAAVLVGLAIASGALSIHGKLADRLQRGLNRYGGRWLGAWSERHALRFQAADEHLAAFFSQRPTGFLAPILLYLLAWVARGIETLLFLRAVGVNIAAVGAMVMEAALILVRAVAMPVPAGLGIQDAGYMLSLKGLGIADAVTVGAAFVLLKRGKDLFWIGVGLVLFAVRRDRSTSDQVVVPPPSSADAPHNQ